MDYKRQYREEHKDEITAYACQYQQERKEEIAAYNGQYYQEHKAEVVARVRRYQLENPEKIREKNRRRRVCKANAITEDVDEQKIYELYDSACIYCGSKESLELDHVVPLSGGGVHAESNLVVACRSCNASKYNKILERWVQTRPDLQVWVM